MTTFRQLSDELQANLKTDSEEFWEEIIEKINAYRLAEAEAKRCSEADKAWFLQNVALSRQKMLMCFSEILQGEYRSAWVGLEQVEITCKNLGENPFLCTSDYLVGELALSVEQWQALYPYRVFASPEFIIHREECSLCGKATGPWSDCEHKVGKVTCGEMCIRIVKDMALQSVSLVREPVQKYSVLIPSGEDGSDPMDYRALEWVAQRCRGPFTLFKMTKTRKVFPHEQFNVGSEDLCPCNSGLYYGSCCLLEEGVNLPHLAVVFDAAPDAELSNSTIFGRSDTP